MELKLGNFNILPAIDNTELVALPTAKLISSLINNKNIGVTEIDQSFSDTAAFCEKYQIDPSITVNCVIIEAKRGEKKQFAACAIPATTKTDVNDIVRKTLDARKASFASMEMAVAETGMEYGGITPIGLPSSWPILIDSRVIKLPAIVIGSGIRKSKIILPGEILATLPNSSVVEGLGIDR